MLRLTSLANKNLRRTLRALYAQTQAYPYAATLDPYFVTGAGITAGALSWTGTSPAAAQKAALLPGMAMIKEVGEMVTVAGGNNVYGSGASWGSNQRAFGLCANFVGGQMDELYGSNQVGVWRGGGGVFELLAPVFNTLNLATEAAAEVGTVATEVYLDPNTYGQLTVDSAGQKAVSSTARLITYLSANAIEIELLV